MTPFL